jgi:hypothetical protein
MGKLEIIKLYHEIKNPPIFLRSNIEINKYWLGGASCELCSQRAEMNLKELLKNNEFKEIVKKNEFKIMNLMKLLKKN